MSAVTIPSRSFQLLISLLVAVLVGFVLMASFHQSVTLELHKQSQIYETVRGI